MLTHKNEWYFAAVVFAIAAYFALFNLGGTPLWHDEAPLAVTGKNIVTTGGYNGWDGRNLFISGNSSDLKMVSYPPWQALPSALGIMLFGANEFGVRFFHAILGLLSLVIFWFLLRMDFLQNPRLRLLAFTLFALSTQALLFFRMGRYTPDAIFFALLLFYAYRLYIAPGGNRWHIAAAALAATLGFLNHFAIGAAFALALGVWHLLYYARQTTARQWVEMAAAAAVSGALCLWYLIDAGIIFSDEKLEFVGNVYQWSWAKRKAYLIFYNFRDLLMYDWLPVWVAVWFVIYAVYRVLRGDKKGKRRGAKKRKGGKGGKKGAAPFDAGAQDFRVVMRWSVLLILFLVFSGLLALRHVATHPLADSRYIAPGLAFTALIVAAFLDWLWRRPWGVFYAAPLALVMLMSNALSYPVIYPNHFSKETVRATLPALAGEISRPYPSYINEAVDYLLQNAEQDDTIFVQPWQDFAVLQFYLTEKLIFCCALDENAGIPEETVRELGAPMYKGDVLPRWHVVVGSGEPDEKKYELVYAGSAYGYPTQRPELEFHLFDPPPGEGHLRIYRRR